MTEERPPIAADNPVSSAGLEPKVDPIVDTHVHVWDPANIPRSWLGGMPSLNRRCSIDEYESEATPLGIRGGVYVETVVDEPFLGAELEGVMTLLDGTSLIHSAVVGGRPGRPGFDGWLRRLAEEPRITGVRCVLHPETETPASLLEPGFVADLRRLGEIGLHFELCIRPDQLAAARELLVACPSTRFVLDHLGRPRVAQGLDGDWLEGLKRLSTFDTVDIKMSALIECCEGASWTPATFDPFMRAAMDVFGSSRMVWGGNWPICSINGSLARWVAATRSFLSSCEPEDRSNILWETARRVYRFS